ncbi:HIR complex subunit [Perkinsus olseni]|uniref:HIR complex subunit n=1 Tax=Perkinsus olseni TaxID=32597 RepID=A0A7J6LCM1_PEROL|nr:HIR complex subunit [Perkinsus olseni]
MGCVQFVAEDEIVIVERFGKFDRLALPGCLCLPVPCICTTAGSVSLRVRQLNVHVETKTKDNVFVTLVVAVMYEALHDRVYEAFYKLTDPGTQINSYVFDAVRASVPLLNLDELFEEKIRIAHQVKEQLRNLMDDFGFRIQEALVVDIEPDNKALRNGIIVCHLHHDDDQVKAAMNEINANRRLRIASQEKAEADKIVTVKKAEAEAESKFLQGEGIARQRRAIVDGLRGSVSEFSSRVEGVGAKDVLELVLITQYFDTLKDVGTSSEASTLFLPHNPGSLAELSCVMAATIDSRLGFLRERNNGGLRGAIHESLCNSLPHVAYRTLGPIHDAGAIPHRLWKPPTDLTHITKRQLSLARSFEDRQRRASSDGWTPAPAAAGEFRPSRRVHETYLGVFLGGKKIVGRVYGGVGILLRCSYILAHYLVMARGQQKAESQRKNALKKAKDSHKGSQLAGQKAALKMTCPQCKLQMTNYKVLTQHFESKHPKETCPTESSFAA